MTLIQPLKNPQTLRWLLFAAFILLLLSLPALAQQSQGGGTSNPLSVVAAPFVIMIFVFGDAILSIFTALRQALRDGNIGYFFFILLLILIGIGVALWVGYYMFELVGKFDSYWPSK